MPLPLLPLSAFIPFHFNNAGYFEMRVDLKRSRVIFGVAFFLSFFFFLTSKGIAEYLGIPGTSGAFIFIALQLSASLNCYNSLLISVCVL